MDNIKILRVIEYSGPRDLVEEQVKRSLHGEKAVYPANAGGRSFLIRVVTLGCIPEIFNDLPDVESEGYPAMPVEAGRGDKTPMVTPDLNCPLRTGVGPCQCNLPRCPDCGYTRHDAAFQLDHESYCGGKIPADEKPPAPGHVAQNSGGH